MARVTIDVKGLREFRAQLKAMDANLPKQMRVALNAVSELVISYARPRVARRTGRAAASLKARSSQTEARIAAGGARAPHYPWLDFGGSVGRHKSVHRAFYTEGRYVYVALRENRQKITDEMSDALTGLATGVGLEVT